MSQLLHFQSIPLLMHLREWQRMAKCLGPLPLTWETWKKLLPPGSSLGCCGHLGSEPKDRRPVPLSFCDSALKTNPSKKKKPKTKKRTNKQKAHTINCKYKSKADVGKWKPSCVANGNVKQCCHTGSIWQFLKKLNILSHHPASPLLDILQTEMKHVSTQKCMHVHSTQKV